MFGTGDETLTLVFDILHEYRDESNEILTGLCEENSENDDASSDGAAEDNADEST